MLDSAYQFVSKPFEFKKEFSEVGNYWELQDKNNHLGIHRRIQIWDRHGLMAVICYCRAAKDNKSSEDAEKAISCCTKAIEINPKYVDLYVSRGSYYDSLGKFDEAISDFDKAIDIDPKDASAYLRRGYEYIQKGQSSDAMADCNKAITLDPKNPKAYYTRGQAYYCLGQYPDAVADFTLTLQNAYRSRGESFYYLHKFNRAVLDFTVSIELDPRDVEAYRGRGNAYYSSSNFEKSNCRLQQSN